MLGSLLVGIVYILGALLLLAILGVLYVRSGLPIFSLSEPVDGGDESIIRNQETEEID